MIARFILTVAHALFWAAKDARDIRGGKNINHPVRWSIRAAVEVGVTLLTMPLGWDALLTTIAAAFLFSGVFRFLLNTMRGRHWAYVSPSSWYDWQFIRLTPVTSAPFGHDYGYSASIRYKALIHRAGTLAYIFEAVVVVVCLCL